MKTKRSISGNTDQCLAMSLVILSIPRLLKEITSMVLRNIASFPPIGKTPYCRKNPTFSTETTYSKFFSAK